VCPFGTSAHPEDTLTVTRRARELGLATTVGVVHNGQRQLLPLGQAGQNVYQAIMQTRKRPLTASRIINQFQKNLVEGNSNDWNCRSGSRYLYVCEDELVHYCSQQRGRPGIHLEKYGKEDLEREYSSVTMCAPHCTISCVH
jgi:hypothetical protein